MKLRALFLLSLVCGGVSLLACAKAMDPPMKPIETCKRSCWAKAGRQCSIEKCERGCEMILDRILEREGEHVISCVGRQSRGCGDVVWAECAAHIGPHADGGPPGPPPPAEDWE